MKNGDVENMEGMPIWQNHEHRLTTIEVNMSNLKGEFKDVKDMIETGNVKQEKKLDAIDSRLMDEFFHKKRTNHENKWSLALKIAGAFVGGGSFFYLLFEKMIGG